MTILTGSGVAVFQGDCLAILSAMPAESVHAVVTDPPYELAFMGKKWDGSGIAFNVDVWRECLRVLKPGGHLLAFGGSRTWHRLAVAIEDAGFEMRDSIAWMYGSGFPKSKSQLKPAFEPIVVARKPLSGTVAANVLKHGTGALNIDGCRVETADALVRPSILRTDNEVLGKGLGAGTQTEPGGRWPTNVVLDGDAAEELDAQSGTLRSGKMRAGVERATRQGDAFGTFPATTAAETHGDSGGASRFFPVFGADEDEHRDECPDCRWENDHPPFRYQAKAPAKERPKVDGIAHPTVKPLALMRWLVRLVTPPGGTVLDPFLGSGTTAQAARDEGFVCLGIERESDYMRLIAQRLGLELPVTADEETAA